MGRHSRSASRSRSRGRGGVGGQADDAYDEEQDGYRVHVADLGVDCSQKELERAFDKFGKYRELWLAKNPPCFAFIVYKHKSDAEDAIKEMDGRVVCNSRIRCSWARPRTRGRNGPRMDSNMRCYQCGERGHFSRDCNGLRRGGYDRHDDRRVRRRRSRSRSRSRDRRRDRRTRSRSRSRSRSRRRNHRSKSDSRDRRRRNRSRSNDKSSRRRSRSRSRSPRKSRSKSRSQNRIDDAMVDNKIVHANGNGVHTNVNGTGERSRSRSKDSNGHISPLKEPVVNHDIYDPTQPDDCEDTDNKLDLSHDGNDALITADYSSE